MITNFYIDKSTVLVGAVSGFTLGTNFPLTAPGAGSLTASWTAPEAGCLYSISGTQQASSSATFSVGVSINGVLSAFVTPPLAFSGTAQTFSYICPNVIVFSALDLITMTGIPSASVTLGITVTASLMVRLGGA